MTPYFFHSLFKHSEESKQDSDMDEPWIMTVKGQHGLKGSTVPKLPPDDSSLTSLTLTHTANQRSSNHNQPQKPHANGASRSPPKDSNLNHYRSDSRDSSREIQPKPTPVNERNIFFNDWWFTFSFLYFSWITKLRVSIDYLLLTYLQSRPHEAAPPPPVDNRKDSSRDSLKDGRESRESSRESTLRDSRDLREGRDSRERERDRDSRERERDRESIRDQRNSKPDIPVVPLVDHRTSDDKQRPRSTQELKHPRSATLSGVILPLLSEVRLEGWLSDRSIHPIISL